MRESAATKARRYLCEGRIVVLEVNPGRVLATARGDGRVYRLGWTPAAGWTCSCAAWTDRCAHLRALRSVVAVDVDRGVA